jgi:hypothetical protein
MAERTVVVTKRDLSIVHLDLGGAVTYTQVRVPGDFSYTAPGWSRVQIYENGTPSQARKGQAEPCSFSYTAHVSDVGNADVPTLLDMLHWDSRLDSDWGASATSTSDGDTDILTVDTQVVVDGATFGLADKTMLFEDVELKPGGAVSFGDSATVQVVGTCLTAIAPVVS